VIKEMIKMNNLELVRENARADRIFLLYPHREFDGLVQAHSIAYNKHIAIDFEFFFEKYGIQVWVDMTNQNIHFYPGNLVHKCFYIRYFARFLYQKNKEAYFIFLYSLFFNMKRAVDAARDTVAAHKAVDAAVDDIYYSTIDDIVDDADVYANAYAREADAAHAYAVAVADAYTIAAADAVEAARAVALVAHKAADAAVDAIYYSAVDDADSHEADAAREAYVARDAVEAVSCIAYTDAEPISHIDVRKALRALFKFRKSTNF
jgi:hypothetical protein